MFDQLKKIFGEGSDQDLASLVKDGAQVVDVRSREEFASGHLTGSINIPLPELNRNLNKLRKDKTVIVCCASGMRSASAKGILQSHGFTAHNGGGWRSLEGKVK
ncbi:rhodanese-like domain-containing protein [Ohtaekwangia koreensis]|uniref:Rhodanese-related sulfurtransferase n=1 Tax=Ohtaekwangia koreensis TaxID=688867 RepID=A0A1T5M715_9BACT|nr:rhodanese-like domain-containing protein [Ohtaekwangia koreensis]SKC83618.1 Rhodanese-related sulfurtransferase [Ohtaekwangia koreensis]